MLIRASSTVQNLHFALTYHLSVSSETQKNKYHFFKRNSFSKAHFVLLFRSCRDFFSAAFSKIAKRDYELRHVCLSVHPTARKEQLGYHWTDFHEIWYLSTFFFSKISPQNSSLIEIWQAKTDY